MTQARKSTADRFAKALGASRVVPIEGVSAQGPLGLLWLRAAAARAVGQRELESATAAEQLRVARPAQWLEIERVAAELSRTGPPVDALELAAHLIEHDLLDLHRFDDRSLEARKDGGTPLPVRLDSFYEGLDSPADCFESVEAA